MKQEEVVLLVKPNIQYRYDLCRFRINKIMYGVYVRVSLTKKQIYNL